MDHNANMTPDGEGIERGRRGRSRLRTSLPARLITLIDNHPVVLLNISLTGARVMLRENILPPPAVGAQVVLQWDSGEAFGNVLRIARGDIGIAFDEPVSPEMLVATRELHDDLARRGGLISLLREEARIFVQGRC
jgi:hypothetical protein